MEVNMQTRRAAALATFALSISCTPNVGDPIEGSISGRVVKAPVAGSDVVVLSVTSEGRRKAAMSRATSSEIGDFSLNVGGHFGPALVCARNGTFVEEA